MDIFDLAAKITLDTSDLESGIASTKNSFEGLTSTAVAVGSAIYDMAKSAVQSIGSLTASIMEVGSSFDASMSNVAAISGAAGDELESLRDKAKEMGATTKYSASEVADAFSYMAMAGWETTDMLDGIEGIMNLAAASGEDLAATSDIVTDALTAFGMAAEDSGRFADVLAAASSSANTNVSMMGDTFKYVAPLAGTLGYSVEDMAVAIGLMANSGTKASQAGTSLRAAISRLVSPTEDAAMLLAEFGVSLTDTDGNMLSFSDTVEALRTAFSGLGEAEQASAAAQLFGQEAMSGMLAIINAAPEDIEKLTKAVENSAGAAEDMASIMQDNVSGAMDELSSALEGAGIAIYETFAEDLQNGILFAADAVSQLTAAFAEGGLQTAAQKAGEIVGGVVDDLVLKFSDMTGIDLSPVVDTFDAVGDAIKKVASAFATGGINGALDELFQTFRDAIGIDLSPIVDGVTAFVDNFTSSSADSLRRFADLAGGLFEDFSESSFAEGINDVVAGLGEFAGWVGELAGGTLADIVDAVGTLVDDFERWVPLIAAVVAALATFAGGLAALSIVESVKTSIQGFQTAFAGLNAVMSANPILLVISLIAALAAALITAWNTNEQFRDGCIKAWNAIKTAAQNLAETVVAFFTETIPYGLLSAIEAIKAKAADFKEAGKNLLEGLKDGILSAVSSVVDAAKKAADKIISAVKGIFGIKSPSKVFREIGNFLVLGLEEGWNDNIGSAISNIEKSLDMSKITAQASVDFASSAVGKSSSAMVNGIMASSSGDGTYNINLVLDGRTLAAVLFDPLNNVARQKGESLANA